MGNSLAKKEESQLEETVDGGYLCPFGVYANQPHDYDLKIARTAIEEKKLAPFYKGLAELNDLNAAFEALSVTPSASQTHPSTESVSQNTLAAANPFSSPYFNSGRQKSPYNSRTSLATTSPANSNAHTGRSGANSLLSTTKAVDAYQLYKGAVECPICFLYYPRNINYARCCDQPICTECFLQLKRSETTNLPVECPFCVEPNFGIIYAPPSTATFATPPEPSTAVNTAKKMHGKDLVGPREGAERPRRKESIGFRSPLVLTCDDIRPDYMRRFFEAKCQATIAQRRPSAPAGRTFGQLGRALNTENNRRSTGSDFAYLTATRGMGAELEELMIMEAVRISLLESEHQEAEERRAAEAEVAALAASDSNSTAALPDDHLIETSRRVPQETIAPVQRRQGQTSEVAGVNVLGRIPNSSRNLDHTSSESSSTSATSSLSSSPSTMVSDQDVTNCSEAKASHSLLARRHPRFAAAAGSTTR